MWAISDFELKILLGCEYGSLGAEIGITRSNWKMTGASLGNPDCLGAEYPFHDAAGKYQIPVSSCVYIYLLLMNDTALGFGLLAYVMDHHKHFKLQAITFFLSSVKG